MARFVGTLRAAYPCLAALDAADGCPTILGDVCGARERYTQARATANQYVRNCIDESVRVTCRSYCTARGRQVPVRVHPRDEIAPNVFPGKATIQATGQGSIVVWIDPQPGIWTMVVHPIKMLHDLDLVWSSGKTPNDIGVYHLQEDSQWRAKRRETWTLQRRNTVRVA